ncbi:hypothetical protein [Pseudarthrobacter sp. S3]|uniref:hypothetical protein n=1 Tax=unclassified Pseudarthrobacter TaxID=2647000 RepID=UPI003CE7870D
MTETAPTLNLLDRPEIPEDVKMLLRVIPGQEQTEQGPPETAPDEGQRTEPYCPPWATFTDPASVESFSVEGQRFIAPAVHEEPNPMLYPMCTVGIVHNTNGSVTGYDYIICKLFNPLGRALGWMGAASFGNEDEYYNKRFVSSGYPGTYGDRPAVELDMGVRDIDNDSPGKEIEFALRADLGPGRARGPGPTRPKELARVTQYWKERLRISEESRTWMKMRSWTPSVIMGQRRPAPSSRSSPETAR